MLHVHFIVFEGLYGLYIPLFFPFHRPTSTKLFPYRQIKSTKYQVSKLCWNSEGVRKSERPKKSSRSLKDDYMSDVEEEVEVKKKKNGKHEGENVKPECRDQQQIVPKISKRNSKVTTSDDLFANFFFGFHTGFQPIKGGRLIQLIRTSQVLFLKEVPHLAWLNSKERNKNTVKLSDVAKMYMLN
ncbi:hypothetical protein MtrunA17_Chr8g0350561 [Medicago truncatula]|uniref:Uncharacterized protein n=1 Tax=Medicago truncatula TaxID=3880 RepID=A0A396GN06_MEDTR|nr:hypothetical protein MtrunA17_Chr8g0350561 [Medicago truncatula]